MTEPTPSLEIPEELPLLPLREFVVFPSMVVPLVIARQGSILAIERALAGERLLLLVAQRCGEVEEPEPEDLHRVGTIAMVMRWMRLADGRVKALVQGLARAEIEATRLGTEVLTARVRPLPPDPAEPASGEAADLSASLRTHVEELLARRHLPPELLSVTEGVSEPGRLADLTASHLRLGLPEAQELLELADPIERLRRLDLFVRRELELCAVQEELRAGEEEVVGRGREALLREQLRAIRSELGEADGRMDEVDEYQEKIDEAGLPDEAHAEALRQLRRLERMHPDGPEAQVVRSYLDCLLELPWSRSSPDRLDLRRAREILDADHAHLAAIKDRILEFLGVRKLRSDSRGPILCLVGPPGVGKTSLGRSIARAMGREFVRISLGGMRDEAEIRGHRRTYVGALPGRIIQGLKQAGTNNPVFLLDEIDKLGSDFRGDPSSALLEVLDPEQNARFSDHYLNVAFDLSRVFFIATANLLDPIPRPLRDRMEVIQLSGYTPEEKIQIARNYLIPHQLRENGLPEDRIAFSDAALLRLVTHYTHEAGVRDLERQIAAVCRKVARRAAEGDPRRVRVDRRNLRRYLGRPPFEPEAPSLAPEVGVASGLAWTEAGGEVLRVEVSSTRGAGLVLTGSLGDVMKESARTALSFVRWRLPELGVDEAALARQEVHVHVPSGAIPKDGPSAGVTIATAIASLVTRVPVRGDVAMTGEVTLRGRVLPVGGVREKALAALRAGIRQMILPRRNLADLDGLPAELRRRLHLHPVDGMDEVLAIALERDPRVPAAPRGRFGWARPAAAHAAAD